MNRLCHSYLKGYSKLSRDQEDMIVDYLADKGIDVDIDATTEEICQTVLQLKPYVPELKQTLNMDPLVYSSLLPADIYLNIAKENDRKTLLSMTSANKALRAKFDDNFFLDYLTRHYPETIKYKPYNATYRQYGLQVLAAIHTLAEDYNFGYVPGMDIVI